MSIEESFSLYKEYIKMQCELLPYAYEFGGYGFKLSDFPTFNEFLEKRGGIYDYLSHGFAECHGDSISFENFLCKECKGIKIYYSLFRGIKFNFRFVSSEDIDLEEFKKEYINNYSLSKNFKYYEIKKIPTNN